MRSCRDCIHDEICTSWAIEIGMPFVNDVTCKYYERIKTAKWISASNKTGVNIGMKCSVCGARIKNSEHLNGNHNFCHKCGADMRGDKNG